MSSSASIRRHGLLHGARWNLANSGSRALWTAATRRELDELLTSPALRNELEGFLGRIVSAVNGVDALLVFDEECVDLEVIVSVRPDRGGRYGWEWVARSAAAVH